MYNANGPREISDMLQNPHMGTGSRFQFEFGCYTGCSLVAELFTDQVNRCFTQICEESQSNIDKCKKLYGPYAVNIGYCLDEKMYDKY